MTEVFVEQPLASPGSAKYSFFPELSYPSLAHLPWPISLNSCSFLTWHAWSSSFYIPLCLVWLSYSLLFVNIDRLKLFLQQGLANPWTSVPGKPFWLKLYLHGSSNTKLTWLSKNSVWSTYFASKCPMIVQPGWHEVRKNNVFAAAILHPL